MLSAGTLLEVAIKASLGKLEVAEEWAEELLAEGFALLPVSLAHARAYRALPYVKVGGRAQRDPFDRLLVAQAHAEGLALETADPALARYGVAVVAATE